MLQNRFIEKLKSVETKDLFIDMLEMTPIGILILNSTLEIEYFNEELSNNFGGNLEIKGVKFGNIFNCTAVFGMDEICGTKEECTICKLKNTVLASIKFNKVINNIQFGKNFSINGRIQKKWFEISVRPIMVGKERYLWITMKDISKLMRYKFEERIRNVRDDCNIMKEKDEFHNKVNVFLENQAYYIKELYVAYIRINRLEIIQEKFGYMWKGEYISSFYRVLLESQNLNDFVCRESENSFLIISPFTEKEDFTASIRKVKNFEHSMFKDNDIEVISATVKLSEARIVDLKEKDLLHIEYFKMLANIEAATEEEIIITM